MLSNVHCNIMAGSFHRNSNSIQSLLMLSWREKKNWKAEKHNQKFTELKNRFFLLFMLAGELATSHESSAAVQHSAAICMAYSRVSEASSCNASIIIVQKSILLFPQKRALINVAMNRARIRGNYIEVFSVFWSKHKSLFAFCAKVFNLYIRSSRASLQTSRLEMRLKSSRPQLDFPFIVATQQRGIVVAFSFHISFGATIFPLDGRIQICREYP